MAIETEIRTGRRFAFGANWNSFGALVDDARIDAATGSLTSMLETTSLSGRTFLDVGCGSGLFSLAAHRLGAKVHSFDVDPDSVRTTQQLRERAGEGPEWTVETGSALDTGYLSTLDTYDVVYSWGVLHHTGDMWTALDNTASLVRPGGKLFISIYNDQGLASRVWRRVKRRYNASGPIGRALLVAASTAYLGRHWPIRKAIDLVRRRPARVRPRGMSMRHDMIDWVGGYPFEVARPEEVFHFLRTRDMELRRLITCGGGLGCNQFVFERPA
jgi:2-polyprenyl-6-hydroxyphenyl methylase/3-demethylubiquinone-9 3-methyltransferase